MLILFPKRKGAKIATTIIFQEIKNVKDSAGYWYVLGMIFFAAKFGAISYDEQVSLTQYLNEKKGLKG
jgi:hypothetical protein